MNDLPLCLPSLFVKNSKRVRLAVGTGILVVLILAFCFPLTPYTHGQEGDIQEALAQHFLVGMTPGHAIQLTLDDDQEPSAALIKRLGDFQLSFCRDTTMNTEGAMVDAVSKQPAASCHIGKIHWKNVLTVEVEAYSGYGPKDAHGSTFTLRRSFHGWVIVGQSQTWVS